MKNLFLALLAAVALTLPATAGTYGTVTVTSTTNFLNWTGVTNAYGSVTNTFSITPPSEFIILTNVVSTNEIFVGSVYAQVPQALLTNFPGYSNLLFIGSISNSFASGLPSGGIWSTTTTPVAGSLSFPLVLQANNGIYTNGIFANP